MYMQYIHMRVYMCISFNVFPLILPGYRNVVSYIIFLCIIYSLKGSWEVFFLYRCIVGELINRKEILRQTREQKKIKFFLKQIVADGSTYIGRCIQYCPWLRLLNLYFVCFLWI